MFLPAYQLRQRQQELAGLMSEVAVARNKIVPKKKFSFASRKKRGAAQPASATTVTAAPPEPEPEAAAEVTAENSRVDENFDPEYLITATQNATIVKRAGEISGHDF